MSHRPARRRRPAPRLVAVWLAALACGAWLASAERVYTQGARTLQTPAWAWTPPIPTVEPGDVEILPVRGNVYMLVGAGSNITVQTGADGVLMVDAGRESMSDEVIAAYRSLSEQPLRYIVNTIESLEHTGGNEPIALTGKTIPFRIETDVRVSDGRLGMDRAAVISFLTTFYRMSAPTGQVAPRPEQAWPDNTYSSAQKKLYMNGEPVVIMHLPSNTDGNSIVHFRGADVLSVGDLVDLTGYPFIDVEAGGSIEAVVQALYRVITITVPNRKSEAGTLVIPGHGRVVDQPDVVYYQQMVGIIRDRILDMIDRGLTLEQVKAARPTRDYDTRFGRETGNWTTDMFVEAAYNSLTR